MLALQSGDGRVSYRMAKFMCGLSLGAQGCHSLTGVTGDSRQGRSSAVSLLLEQIRHIGRGRDAARLILLARAQRVVSNAMGSGIQEHMVSMSRSAS